MKCHDLRYHIDTYRRAQQLDEHAAFFDEVEQEIQRYEYTFHTGNAALLIPSMAARVPVRLIPARRRQ